MLSAFPIQTAQAVSPDIVISQVYGGGGNSGATLTNDFIELFNRGISPVSLTGWSVQYASSSGSTWQVTAISGTVQPGQYYLVQEAAGAGGTTSLPTPDAVGSIAMSGTSGKVVVVSTTTALSGTNPSDASIVDVVGYGTANFFEGSATAPGLSNTTADSRAGDGCIDTDDNSADFTAGAPNPRNTVSPLNECGGGGPTPGQPLPLTENFDSCALVGWEIISVDADAANTWSCNASFSNIEANGFGDSAPANEWLITPALNLNAQGADTLTFRSHTSFTDANYPQLHVLYSTDYDGGGDPTSATWTELTGITFSPENSGTWTDSGEVDLSGISGTNVYIAFQYVSSGNGSGTAARWRLDAINIFEQTAPSGWIINEINADPDSTLGDANGDGTAHFSDDEFVELVNTTGSVAEISGWTLSDGFGVRHTFPSGTVVPNGCTIVVFGGGTPTGTFGNGVIQTASSGLLGLNNTGDSVTLAIGSLAAASATYGSDGGDNQSLTLAPDITGASYVKHSTATGSGGTLFSPGTQINGSLFSGCLSGNLYIHDVQGNGSDSPANGNTVTVEAIVVGDYQTQGSGQLRGFFLQEEDADVDANPATSEGIFVFCSSCPTAVSVGDKVKVTGPVSEFFGMTQITASSAASVNVINSGNTLPTPATVDLPVPGVPSGDLVAATTAINAYFEAFEGMLVTFPDELSVSEYFELARYGQVILTEGGRPHTFTAVNTPSAAGFIDNEIELASRTIILDDTDNRQNRPVDTPNTAYYYPVPGLSTGNYFRGGDTITNLTGVLHWSFAGQSGTDAWRIRPVTEVYSYAFTPVNTRPSMPDVDGDLKVASFNVLNYFLTVDTTSSNNVGFCGPSGILDCRGADSALELERQRTKMLAALSEIDADVFGFMEMENSPGVEPLADIVSGLPGYDYVDTGVIGTDAIRVGIIYKTASVVPVGDYAILDSSVDARFDSSRNRPALAQTFESLSTGGRLTVVVNHLKSKGSGCGSGDDDTTAGQGNCNGTRTLAAEALADWLATDPTNSGDTDFLIIGDLNSYAKEDPIVALQNAGYTDMVAAFGGPSAYGYVFDGQLGYLDHALASADLVSEIVDVAEWHINADEIPLFDYNDDVRDAGESSFEEESDVLPLYEPNAFRTSDHDPVIIGLDVCDEIAPTFDEVSVTPDVLWPANHKYVNVEATVRVSDNFDPNPTVELVSVVSNEPDDGEDDGNTTNDIVIVDDFHFKLRAERSGIGTGRVYTITYKVTDACGNFSIATVTVTVPLSQGN